MFGGHVLVKTRRHVQGCNEVTWHQGQEASLAHPCSNLRSFGTKCTVLKKVRDIARTFRRPYRHSARPQCFDARGIVPPLTPWSGPWSYDSSFSSSNKRSRLKTASGFEKHLELLLLLWTFFKDCVQKLVVCGNFFNVCHFNCRNQVIFLEGGGNCLLYYFRRVEMNAACCCT